MPKIINAYSPDDGIGASLKGLADSFFTNTPQNELYRQKAKGLIRENENIPLLADAIVANDVNAAARAGILSGLDPKNVGGYGQYVNVNRFGPGSNEATTATMAVPGASYGSTVAGTRESEANRVAIENLRTDRLFDAERYKTDNTPQMILDANNNPIIGRRSESFGQRPVLGHSEAQGTILQQDAAGYTPEQRAQITGAAPKNPSNIWVYQRPDGTKGNTLDGKTDAQTGQPITGPAMKLEGPNTEGLSGNSTVDQRLLEARVATGQAVKMIDGLSASLSQPNADQSTGYLASVARAFNDLRSQSEATVRLFGGETHAQAFLSPENKAAVDGAMNALLRDPSVIAKAQQLGIDSSKIRSQVQDLAYMISKAQDPSGRVGVDDIRRAMETVGGTIQDPKVAVSVLQDLRQRLLDGQEVREAATRQMYPKTGAAPAAPAPSTPQAPGTTPSATIRWGRGPDGQPARIQPTQQGAQLPL